MHRPPAHAAPVLAENRRNYDRLVDVVRAHAERGDVERVLRSATFAAGYGWLSPVGLLSDPVLERLVVSTVNGGVQPTVDGTREHGRVLHVLTEAYETGGHTRLACRWMNRDPRPSDVVLTNHHSEVPEALTAAARRSGSDVIELREQFPDLAARAAALRTLMDGADLVVLHIHGNDAVVLAAVNLPGVRPPVIFENHADHAYWLGLGAADVLCDLRTSASRLSTELRGFAPERIGVLPVPVEAPPASGPTPAELRAELGIRPDAVVAVTVAAEFKVAATWGRGMDQLIERALTWSPRLTVVLAGTPATGSWKRLTKEFPGRFFAVGTVAEPAPWYALADIYLDSYPSRSVTSALEAALLGIPLLTIEDLSEDGCTHIFQADSPGLVGRPRVSTREQYALALRRLVADADRRAREGAEVAQSVRRAHTGADWLAAMERLYAQARRQTACDLDEVGDRIEDPEYGAFYLSYTPTQTASPDPRRANWALRDDATLLGDVLAVFERDRDRPVQVRVAPGWAQQPDWTARLLALTAAHPRLTASLPFLPGDDAEGSRTVAQLTALLVRAGRSTEDCGDVSLDAQPPYQANPTFPGELLFTDHALDVVEALLTSPCRALPALAAAAPAAGRGNQT